MARFLQMAVGHDAAATHSAKPLAFPTDSAVMLGRTPYLSLLDTIVPLRKATPSKPKAIPRGDSRVGEASRAASPLPITPLDADSQTPLQMKMRMSGRVTDLAKGAKG